MLYVADFLRTREEMEDAEKCKAILFQANYTYNEVKKLLNNKSFMIWESLEEFENDKAKDIEDCVDEDRSYEQVLADFVNDLEEVVYNEHTYYIERYL